MLTKSYATGYGVRDKAFRSLDAYRKAVLRGEDRIFKESGATDIQAGSLDGDEPGT